MNDVERKRVENTVAAFVEKRCPPVHLRDKVDLGFRFDGRSVVSLRVAPPRNRQRGAINWARDFAFEATIGRTGAVAQLGERRDGIAEARGSNPLGSICSEPGMDDLG